MSEFPPRAGHADWLRHFLDLSRKFFGLHAPSSVSDEKPAEPTPQPGDRADSSDKSSDEK
jgi:hypothetical protein